MPFIQNIALVSTYMVDLSKQYSQTNVPYTRLDYQSIILPISP